MHTFVICLLLSMIALSQIHCACRNDTTELAPDVCVRAVGDRLPYCIAHEFCEMQYEATGIHMFLIGKDAMHLIKVNDPFLLQRDSFTSINSLYEARPNSQDGWRVGDPREANYTIRAADFPWNQTGGSDNRIVVFWNGQFSSVAQPGHVGRGICQSYPSDYKPSPVEPFKFNWPSGGDIVSIGDPDNGCWRESNTLSKLHCAFLCKRNQQCRSFYFNEATNVCKQSLYVDSSLFVQQVNPADRWIRFGRPFWGF